MPFGVGQQIECDEARRVFMRHLRDTRRRRMRPELQHIKQLIRNDQLTVQNEASDWALQRSLDDLGKVALQRPLPAGLQIDRFSVAKHHAAKAVVFLFKSQPAPAGSSLTGFASMGSSESGTSSAIARSAVSPAQQRRKFIVAVARRSAAAANLPAHHAFSHRYIVTDI